MFLTGASSGIGEATARDYARRGTARAGRPSVGRLRELAFTSAADAYGRMF